MDTLLKPCAEKKRNSVLDSDVKQLTHLLAEVWSDQKSSAVKKQSMENALSVKVVTEKRILEPMHEVEALKCAHAKILQASDAEICKLKVLLVSLK